MKLFRIFSIAALAAMVLVSCKDDDDSVDPVDSVEPAALPEVTISGSAIDNVTVKLSKTSESAVSVVLESDNADFAVTSPVSIAAGKTTANVTVTPAEGLAAGTYEPTISIKSADGATVGAASSAKIAYEVKATDNGIAAAAIDFANIQTLDLHTKDFSCKYYFNSPIKIDGNLTFVFNVLLDEAPGQQSALTFGDINPDYASAHMLRFGEGGHSGQELELMLCESSVNPSDRVKEYFDAIEVGKWATMAITADENGNYVLYTDGNESKTFTGKGGKPSWDFQSLEFANSWGASYRKPFTGNICGVSIWTRTLTADEVASLTGKAPKLDAEGLAAYWAFDEGKGTTVDEKTGRYEDIDFTKSTHNNNDGATQNEIFDNTANIVWD